MPSSWVPSSWVLVEDQEKIRSAMVDILETLFPSDDPDRPWDSDTIEDVAALALGVALIPTGEPT